MTLPQSFGHFGRGGSSNPTSPASVEIPPISRGRRVRTTAGRRRGTRSRAPIADSASGSATPRHRGSRAVWCVHVSCAKSSEVPPASTTSSSRCNEETRSPAVEGNRRAPSHKRAAHGALDRRHLHRQADRRPACRVLSAKWRFRRGDGGASQIPAVSASSLQRTPLRSPSDVRASDFQSVCRFCPCK
jgi:hypothetical protein